MTKATDSKESGTPLGRTFRTHSLGMKLIVSSKDMTVEESEYLNKVTVCQEGK